MTLMQTRRRFLRTLSLAGTAGLGLAPRAFATEGPLETTTVRISNDLAICEAPLKIAEELLRAEGFTDVRYADTTSVDVSAAIAQRKVDFALDFPVFFAPGIDTGKPITVLAGVHVGCFELFAGKDVRTIADLKDKTVGFEIAPAGLLRLMVAQVGLDPDKDIRWVTDPSVKPLELFVEGKIDAFAGFPPEPQQLRARKAGIRSRSCASITGLADGRTIFENHRMAHPEWVYLQLAKTRAEASLVSRGGFHARGP